MWHKHSYTIFVLFMVIGLLTFTGFVQGTSQFARDNTQSPGESNQKLSTVYDIDRIIELNQIKIRIINVGMVRFDGPRAEEQGQIALGLEIANTGDKEVSYMPEQITLTGSSGETLLPDLNISEKMSGPYPPKRIMQGFMIFPLEGKKPENFSNLTIKFPCAMDSSNQPLGKELKVDIKLKPGT